MDDKQTCCVTGHRPKGFPWNYYDKECKEYKRYCAVMAKAVEKCVTEKNVSRFISGGALGVDMDFAETVIFLKESMFPFITLEIAVPCLNQDKMWNSDEKARYKKILAKADLITQVSESYTAYCMQKRNEYMVDNSDFVLAFWNGDNKGGTVNTMTYAKKKNKNLIITKLEDIQKGATA